MAVPPQLILMAAEQLKKKQKEQKEKIKKKFNHALKDNVAPAVSTTAGLVNMYNDQSENPDVGVGILSGAAEKGAMGFQNAGISGLIGGGIMGGIMGGISSLNRAEQKAAQDQNAYANQMYGTLANGEDYDLQLLLHQKTGGEVIPTDIENGDFVPIQAEAREVKRKGKNGKSVTKLVKEKFFFSDGKISDTNADKPHSEMGKDEVTDIVKAGTYVFPVYTKLSKSDLNSLVSYSQGNYEENGRNFEIGEIRLKDVLGEDFEGSFAEAVEIIDKKYPIADVNDRSDRISLYTNNDNLRNRAAFINHLIRLNEAKLNNDKVDDVKIVPDKVMKAGSYVRKMKTGGMVMDPPKKKPYQVSWSDSSSGAKDVEPVSKSEYATRESRETYKDNNKKQADINDRANQIIKNKKTGEYTDEDIRLINSSTIKNKDLVIGDDNIAKANAAKQKDDSWTAEGFKNSTAALGDKLSLRRIPGIGEYIPGFLDVTKDIGDMAAGLGEIPSDLQKRNYGAAAGKVAIPLAVGALGGIGVQNTGQFVNNVVNPFAGLLDGGIGTKQELKEIYDIVTKNKKVISGLNQDEKEVLSATRYVGGLIADGTAQKSISALENIKKKADRLSDEQFKKITGFEKSDIDQRIEDLRKNTSKKSEITNQEDVFDYGPTELDINTLSVGDQHRIRSMREFLERNNRSGYQYSDGEIASMLEIRRPNISEFDLTPDQQYLGRVDRLSNQLSAPPSELIIRDSPPMGRSFYNFDQSINDINLSFDINSLPNRRDINRSFLIKNPSLLSKIRDRIENIEKPVDIDPSTKILVGSSFRSSTNPVKQVVGAYNEVKNAPKGSSFLSSTSLSADSYNRLTLPLIEKSLKDGLVEVSFHGYKQLNKMSFPEKAGISNETILKEMNDKIISINKITGKNYPLGKIEGDIIKYPEFSVKKLKKGGLIE